MIHFLHQFMTLMEKRDISQTLEQLTTQTDDGNCQSLALDNGMILPPVPLTTIPYVKWVTRLQIWCRLLNSRALIYLLKKIFQMLLSSCIWCLLCLLINKWNRFQLLQKAVLFDFNAGLNVQNLKPWTLSHVYRSFKLIRMRPHLEPVKLKRYGESTNSGPFIFTPLNLGMSRNDKDDGKMGK